MTRTGDKPSTPRRATRQRTRPAPASAATSSGKDAVEPATEHNAAGRTHAVRRDEAERRLLAAAVSIVADRGIEGMTLAEVGEVAGYSRGLPGHYFGRKSDLVVAVASHIADGFANRLAQTSTRQPGLDSVLYGVAAYFNGALRGPANTRALLIALAEALTEPVLSDAMSGVTQRSVGRLRSMIRQGIERGEIRRDVNPQAQAVMILGTLRASVAQWTTDPERIDLNVLRDHYVAALQRSLAA